MSKRLISFLTLILFLATLLSFAAGYFAREIWPLPSEQILLLKEARRLLGMHYLDPLPDDLELERGMIHGMMGVLPDPYSRYVEPATHEIQTDDLAGEYAGIGAEISRGERGQFYLVPIEDGPAEAAGILEGDVLLAIDGVLINEDTTLESVITRIRGPEGSAIRLTVAARDPKQANLEFEITRAIIPLPSVMHYLLPEEPWVGVINVRRFSEKTPGELEKAYKELINRGAKSIILDLRDNSGGLLDASIESSRLFLEDGLVVVEERSGMESQIFYVHERGLASEMPMVVLVNARTASAAEVVAASLQDNGRSLLIGEATFGKGSVQVILELSDGSSLHVTSARWLTPKGNVIDNIGLLPDIIVEQKDPNADNGIAVAVEWLREHR
ncbi:MAG: S41 family peptidase [Anaerolineales bacterium]|nr:MAG: S41 family peptidase [Anaerolineales bacterium]